MQQDLFYNTTNETGEDLKKSISKAKTQQDKIKDYFKSNPTLKLTPFEVMDALGFKNVPITSIRRCMTNLTQDSVLVKTSLQKSGEYGKNNYCWTLNIIN